MRTEIHAWPALMGMKTAAAYLDVSEETIREWYAGGLLNPHPPLPGIRGRQKLERILFPIEELRRFAGLKPL